MTLPILIAVLVAVFCVGVLAGRQIERLPMDDTRSRIVIGSAAVIFGFSGLWEGIEEKDRLTILLCSGCVFSGLVVLVWLVVDLIGSS